MKTLYVETEYVTLNKRYVFSYFTDTFVTVYRMTDIKKRSQTTYICTV